MESHQWLDTKKLELWVKTPVKEFVRKNASGRGDNYLSDLHRLLVTTLDGDISLIVKCRLEQGTVMESLEGSSIYVKEQEMYGSTLARLEELLFKALPDNFEPLSPKCYYSCEKFLVMEDLIPEGFKMEIRQKGLDLTQSLSVMKAIARFHAASIKLHELDPNAFKQYQVNFFSEPSTTSTWDTCFKGWMQTFIEELETWPEEQWSHYVLKLRELHPNFLKRVQETTKRCDSDFNVLIHGDLWINNMLLNGDSVRFVDFQCVQFTSFALDLHVFLATSVNMEVRLNHRELLIQEYHSNLCKTMTALGCERKLPTLEEVHEEIRRKAMYGIFGIVCAGAVMTTDPDCGFDLNELMKGNPAGPGMYNGYFREIAKWGIPLLNDMGVFDRI